MDLETNSVGVIVDLPGLGKLRGSRGTTARTGRNILQFLGVKYAEAPVGELRFKKPVPVAPWSGVRDATTYGPLFPSFSNYTSIPDEDKFNPIHEDCLTLCVYTTNLAASQVQLKKNPVMVYIHGGDFKEGGSPHHPPNYLLEKDIVLVVPQYRLGPLGFLSLMTDGVPGNAGVLDVVEALEWVQKNIQFFGGDPKNVTVFGQSGGAGIVSHLTISPLVSENLLHRIILQSGSSFGQWAVHFDPIADARKTAIASGGCTEASTVEEIEQHLLKMDIKTLIECSAGTRSRPVVGGPSGFLPDTPDQIFLKGAYRKNLPVMLGVTKNDGGYLVIQFYKEIEATIGLTDTNFNAFNLIHNLLHKYRVNDTSGILAGFLSLELWQPDVAANGDFLKMLPGFYDFMNTYVFKGPVLKFAQMNAAVNPKQTWLYTLDYKGEHTRHGYGEDTSKYPIKGGVAHSDDNIYLFPWPENVATLNEEDTKFSMIMVDLWTSFATDGVPSSPQIFNWPHMETPIGPYLHLNINSYVEDDFRQELKAVSRM